MGNLAAPVRADKEMMFTNRQLVALMWPLLLEQFLAITVGLADSLMVATVGDAAISAVSLVDSISNLMIYIFSAMATGGAAVAGQYIGQRQKEDACNAGQQLIALLAVACILTLAWFAVRASRTGRSSFYTIAACAAGSLLVFQTSLNVFGSVDLLPLTGVTFPFVSNGGSAMLSAWGLLAYLKAMDTRADASFAIGRAAERKLDEEAARMAAPAEDAFEKEDGHAED